MSTVTTERRKGVSLAKGPVAIVGMVGIAMGVCGLIFGGHGFHIANVPHGSIYGKRWLGIELNSWTNLLFIAAGLFLLLFSPAHWGAKAAAWIVAGVLGAAAIIGVIRGNGIFGIFAADHRTEIVWGAAAIVLLALSLLPRVGRRERVVEQQPRARESSVPVEDEPTVASRDRSAVTRREPVPAETTEDPQATREDPEATREYPEETREYSEATRDDPDATAEDPEAIPEERRATAADPEEDPDVPREATERGPATARDEPLVAPRDDAATDSPESPARP
jgi:hypothetical protein